MLIQHYGASTGLRRQVGELWTATVANERFRFSSSPSWRSSARARLHPRRSPQDTAPGEILIGFRDGVSTAEQNKVLAKVGATEKRKFTKIHGALLDLKPEKVERALEQLRADDRVRYAEPNTLIHLDALPNDPFFNRLWGLNNTGQTVQGLTGLPDADIDAPEAWNVTTGSNAVTVAVIDTGIDGSHPDLSSQMWINPGENCTGCRTDRIDNDGNGYVDDWRGWDWVNHDNNPADDHGHGTHVAGTIGASGNNGIGVTGVNWHVRLMPLKFLSSAGSGTTADAVSAVLYAADKGADVMNNSWGGDTYSQALADAIAVADDRGSLFVAASGNSSNDNDANPDYPSSYDNPNVISVAATEHRDGLAWFSNIGRRTVDLGAPGLNVYSTWPGGSYQFLTGTSMAAPHVSGAAALVKAAFPNASDLGIKALLLSSVDPNASLAGVDLNRRTPQRGELPSRATDTEGAIRRAGRRLQRRRWNSDLDRRNREQLRRPIGCPAVGLGERNAVLADCPQRRPLHRLVHADGVRRADAVAHGNRGGQDNDEVRVRRRLASTSDHCRRACRHGHDEHDRRERPPEVRRPGRTARERQALVRDDVRGVRLDPEVGRDAARRQRLREHLRRLPRHAHAAGDGELHDPRGSARNRNRFDDREPLRRAGGSRRHDHAQRRIVPGGDRNAGPERAPDVHRPGADSA